MREGSRAHCLPLPPSAAATAAAAECGVTSYHSTNECTSQATKELHSSGLPGSDVHSSAGADLDDDDAWLPAEGDSSDGGGGGQGGCPQEAGGAGTPDAAAVTGDEVEGEEEGSYEADEQEEEEEEELVYCTNCTAALYTSFQCDDCGHAKAQDTSLFSCEQQHATGSMALALPPHAHQQQQQRPLLIWDEHMLLHDEGKVEPHPERPDRLRAIMAQLTRSGLTGGRHCSGLAQCMQPPQPERTTTTAAVGHQQCWVCRGPTAAAAYMQQCRPPPLCAQVWVHLLLCPPLPAALAPSRNLQQV
jgi:hypothetical protein